MPTFVTGFLGIFSILALLLCYRASSDIAENLSPQGCRMSWMSPSYVQQPGFNTSWSPLARRYSLWLYREVDWDLVQETGQRTDSLPVLFIPGNAGSSHQVRSIASSATRQYYSSPYVVSPAFASRSLKPLDFFAVEFNEDLSAFHGSTLESQIAYTAQAISYILSLYPPNTKITVMGHSMGGVVAMALLPSTYISAIITMSTPHTLPPARFDSRIDTLFTRLQKSLEGDATPVVSICGGATDMMIPSESCILPTTSKDIFRRTVFTSALEGAWTGVGHREMVWCHQVRWKVARAALELGGARTLGSRAVVLDKWLRDGHSLPLEISPSDQDDLDIFNHSNLEQLKIGQRLVLKHPNVSRTYLLPADELTNSSSSRMLTVFLSQGSISSMGPENPIPLRVSVFSCRGDPSTSVHCTALKPETLKLIPNPAPHKTFPVPHEGSDESEGVVLYEAHIPRIDNHHWIGIKVDNANEQGWVVAGLDFQKTIVSEASSLSLLSGALSLSVPPGLATSFTFPNLLSDALMVYRVTPQQPLMPMCSDALLPPLLMHTSHPAETHYYPLANVRNRRILLHTHLSAPFIEQTHYPSSMLNFTIYSFGEPGCEREFETFAITIDWSATLGRWASRYINTLVSWSAGVASLVVFVAWSQKDHGAPVPSVGQSLTIYARFLHRYLLPGSLAFSFLPLSRSLFMGHGGVPFLAPMTPLILLIASGLVFVVWWILLLLLTVIGACSALVFGSRREKDSVARSTILSLAIICAVIFVFVPWQVAYLGCWLLHLHTCASSAQQLKSDISSGGSEAVPLVDRARGRDSTDSQNYTPPNMASTTTTPNALDVARENAHHNFHLLLLMTWLLPLTSPVLVVWVRTLLTAGYTTPFDGDHNFLAVLPFLVLTDFASWTTGPLFEKASFERQVSLRWVFVAIAGTSFMYGSRRPYLVLDVARVAIWSVVIFKIGRRYWGGSSWSSVI